MDNSDKSVHQSGKNSNTVNISAETEYAREWVYIEDLKEGLYKTFLENSSPIRIRKCLY